MIIIKKIKKDTEQFQCQNQATVVQLATTLRPRYHLKAVFAVTPTLGTPASLLLQSNTTTIMKKRLGKAQSLKSDREKAKEAALQTSQNIYSIVSRTSRPLFQQGIGSDSSIISNSEQGNVPVNPLRNAVERGHKRGMNENADLNHNTSKAASTLLRNERKQRQRDQVGSLVARTSQLTTPKEKKKAQSLWMCPSCGAAFPTKIFASEHETVCLSSTFIVGSKGTISINERNFEDGEDTIENSIPLKRQIKMSMIMMDESLIKVAQRISKYSLSDVQSDAERGLSFKVRDRAYYNFMANLSRESSSKVSHKKRGNSKFISKIQNKISDAYTLIKEGGIDEQERVDQYNISRGQHQGSNEFRHDSETTYINIVVKHSVLFVNNELERLANERWFYEKKEYKNHFERIRTMAHTNAVRYVLPSTALFYLSRKMSIFNFGTNTCFDIVMPNQVCTISPINGSQTSQSGCATFQRFM